MAAFGAHVLGPSLDGPMREIYQTAVRFQFHHALGLCIVALAIDRLPHRRLLVTAGWLLFAGSVVFSLSLFFLALAGIQSLGAMTPFGGTALILGWVLLAIGALRQSQKEPSNPSSRQNGIAHAEE